MTVLTLADAQPHIAVFFAFISLVMVVTTAGLWKVVLVLSRWPQLWSWDERRRCVVMTAPRELARWEAALPLLAVTAPVPVIILVYALQGPGRQIGAAGWIVFLSTYYGPQALSILRHRRLDPHALALTRQGVELTHIDGGRLLLPWSQRPRLAGRTNEGHLLIVLRNGQEAVFPGSYLPVGAGQLERLLTTYWLARNRSLLDTPQALDHVLATLQPTPEELADTPWMWRYSTLEPPTT